MAVDGAGLVAVSKMVPRGRPGELGGAAGATTFFASRAGAYVTGAVLALDGGMSL
jgi:NAD(P)-dependent dehydrogenase (short-subunit alcohol dehydrogenase family)